MDACNQTWAKEIGVSVDPNNILPARKNMYHKAKLFDGCSFTTKDGSELPIFKPPAHGYEYDHISPDTPVSDFSVIDFNVIPMRCCASVMLKNYVASHVGYED